MDKLKKEDIPQEAFDLYDYYCHNKLDRRTFVEKLSAYAVGGITVTALMSSMILHQHTHCRAKRRANAKLRLCYI